MPSRLKNGVCGTFEAIDDDGTTFEALVMYSTLERLRKYPAWKSKQLQYLVPPALRSPKGIFKGIRDENDFWRAYVDHPSKNYQSKGQTVYTVDFPDGFVFCVYLNEQKVVCNWHVVENDENNPKFPENYEERYGHHIL